MAVYLTVAKFKLLTTLPDEWIDEVEADHAGWLDAQLDAWGRWIDSRLRKRYASPFAAHDADPPTPVAVQGWLARLVTLRVLLRRGVDSSDEHYETIREDFIDAKAEITEAADSKDGAFDLPLRTEADATAITSPETRAYTEQSPYVAFDVQATTGREEDSDGEGTYA